MYVLLTLKRGDEIFFLVELDNETSATATLRRVHRDVDTTQWQGLCFPTRHIDQDGHRSMEVKLGGGDATLVGGAQAINSSSRMETPELQRNSS